MLKRNFFSHTNPDGQSPTDRAKEAGVDYIVDHGSYRTIGIAENIAGIPFGYIGSCGLVDDDSSMASCAMKLWMLSPGHKANILNSRYADIGIGVFCNEKKCLLTQNFR